MKSTISFPVFGDSFILNIPRYFTVFGLSIYYYALFIVLGFGLAAVYIISRRKLFNLTTDNVLDLLLIAVPCGILGARLYYMLFNFSDFFGPGQWGNILRIRDGGLAVYGGIILTGFAFVIYSRKKDIRPGNILDASAFGLFIGQAIGRWGNFVNAEAYGVETELPWRMGITQNGVTTYHHPAFLYESLWNLGGLLIMHVFSKRFKTKYPGQYFLFYMAWYGFGRFMIEGLRVDSLYLPGSEIRVSQLIAALSAGVAVTLLITWQSKKPEDTDTVSDDNDEIDDVDEDENEDEETLTDEEFTDELAELDGAAAEDIENENEEDLQNG